VSHNTRTVDLGKPVATLVYAPADLARFWEKVDKTAACWLWRASVFGSLEYGQFTMPSAPNGRVYAHRVSWELANGPIPDGQFILHSCDTPRCVNPAHLRLGNHKDNMEDAQARGRLHTPRPNRQKIPDAELPKVFELRRGGEKLMAIAHRYGVSIPTISLILRGARRQYAPVAVPSQRRSA
jgi:hypothetical protein